MYFRFHSSWQAKRMTKTNSFYSLQFSVFFSFPSGWTNILETTRKYTPCCWWTSFMTCLCHDSFDCEIMVFDTDQHHLHRDMGYIYSWYGFSSHPKTFLSKQQQTAPPESIEFSVEPIKHEDKILLSYRVEKVYPLPVITIYQTCLQEGRKRTTSGGQQEDEPEDLQATDAVEEERREEGEEAEDPITREEDNDNSSFLRDDEDEDEEEKRNDLQDKTQNSDGQRGVRPISVTAKKRKRQERKTRRKMMIGTREEMSEGDKEDEERHSLPSFNDKRRVSFEKTNHHPLVANHLDDQLSAATEPIVHSRDSWTKNNSSSKRQHIKLWNQGARKKSIGLRMEMPVSLNERMTSASSPPFASRTKVLIHQSKEWFVSADNVRRQQLNDPEETRDEGDDEEEEENNFISTDDVIESSKERRRKKMLLEDQEQEKVSQDHSSSSSSSSSLLSSEEGQAVYTMQHVQFMDLVEVLDNHRRSGCFSFGSRMRATPVIFELKLTIPSTEFVVRKSIEYFPGEYFERIFNLTGNIYKDTGITVLLSQKIHFP